MTTNQTNRVRQTVRQTSRQGWMQIATDIRTAGKGKEQSGRGWGVGGLQTGSERKGCKRTEARENVRQKNSHKTGQVT